MRHNNGKIHYAWIVMTACFVFYAALVGMMYNTRGMFYSAIAEDMGWKYSSIAVSSLIMGLSAVAALKIVPKLFAKYPVKWVLIVTSALYSFTLALRACMTSLLGFCILSAFTGIFSAFIIFVPLPMIINNWFIKCKGMALGIASLASGVGAAIAGPILSNMIVRYGWQRAAVISAAASAVIALPVIFFFIEGTPQEKNMKPYGYHEDEGESIKTEISGNFRSHYSKEEKRKKLILCFIFAVLTQLIAGAAVQLPDYAIKAGMTIIIGGTLTAISNIGNIAGKGLGGICMDRIGIKNTTLGILIITAAGLVMLIFGKSGIGFMYAGAFIIGVTAMTTTVVPPAITDTFAKGNEYVECMSKVSMGTMLAAAFTSYLPGIMYDIFQSYDPVWILFIVFDVVSMILAAILLKDR